MLRKLLVPVLVVSALVALVACGSGDDGPRAADPSTGDAAVTVRIAGLSFSPEAVAIRPGDSIAWVWDGEGRHDVVFDDGPASTRQRSGTWQRTFERSGIYEYVCTLHPGMEGTVVVG